MKNLTIVILGTGSWGTALGISLAKHGHDVTMWGRNSEKIEEIQRTRVNKSYLPNVILPENMTFTQDIKCAIEDKDIVVFSVSTQSFRAVLKQAKPYLKKEAIIVNTAKGIEINTLDVVSQIVIDEKVDNNYVMLSGPSHAEEVATGLPTTLVASSLNEQARETIQTLFGSPVLRVYTSSDVLGVELGGALKNIIAIGAGVSDGLQYGDNTKAALITRGMAEIARLGVKMGGQQETFYGLSGIGDLIVTCTSQHSRNRKCGFLLGKGHTLDAIKKEVGMVIEGVYTAQGAFELSRKYAVDMPITQGVCTLLEGKLKPEVIVKELMTRSNKSE